MELVSKVFGHWTGSNQAWKSAEVNQRKDERQYFTEGKDLQEKTRVFCVDQHTATGSFFPQARALTSLVQSTLYVGLTPAHKALTAAGNGALMLVDVASAIKSKVKKEAAFRDAMEPAVTRFKQLGKDAVVLGIPTALGYYNTTYLQYAAMGVAGLVGAYSLFNPRGLKQQVSRLEGRALPLALNDAEASTLSRKDRAVAVLDGSYSLARILRMHCMGTTTEMVGDQKRFEFVTKDDKKAE